MTDSPIDAAILKDLGETTGAEFLGELVSAFLSEAPGMMDDLTSALQNRDEDSFRRAAHSLKSNANVFGAQALAEQARQLELAGLPAEGAVDENVASLKAELARATEALKAYADG
jgi:HPt (histidine-containing phosphotransfer) domain-containing protein